MELDEMKKIRNELEQMRNRQLKLRVNMEGAGERVIEFRLRRAIDAMDELIARVYEAVDLLEHEEQDRPEG